MEKAMHQVIKWLKLKDKMHRDLDNYHATIQKEMNVKVPTRLFKKNTTLKTLTLGAHQAYLIEPKNSNQAISKTVLYLHGGAYLYGIDRQHWQFISALVENTGCSVLLPNYPLDHHTTAHAMIARCYDTLIAQQPQHPIVLMGDSAGGGMALGFAQSLLIHHRTLPEHIVLLSPWLDVSMSDPHLPAKQHADPILDIEALKRAGALFGKNIETSETYRISPLLGPINGLPQLTIFTGTNDLLNCDARRLHERYQTENIPMNYYEEEGQLHDWMLIPTPAAKRSNGILYDLIRKASTE